MSLKVTMSFLWVWTKRIFDFALIGLVAFLLYQKLPGIIDNWKSSGQMQPEFEAENSSGLMERFPNSHRRLIVFWATWCGPCGLELSRIQNLIRWGILQPNEVAAISSGEARDLVLRTSHEKAYTFNIYMDSSYQAAKINHIEGTPTLIMINEKNEIIWKTSGVSPLLEIRLWLFFRAFT